MCAEAVHGVSGWLPIRAWDPIVAGCLLDCPLHVDHAGIVWVCTSSGSTRSTAALCLCGRWGCTRLVVANDRAHIV
jgi:hypothetical protein